MIPVLVLALLLLMAPVASAQEAPVEEKSAGRTLTVTLGQAIEHALENNLDLQIARTTPQIAEEQLGQARGAFDPLGFAEYGFDHAETPVASPVQSFFGGGRSIMDDEWTYTGGFAGIIPLGLRYGSTYNFNRLDTSSGFNALERENRATVVSEVTLPLLRDLIHNEANVTVKRSRIAKQISEEEFRQSLSDVVLAIEQAYWELAASRAEVQVAKKSLQTAQDLLEQTRVRYEVGVVARVLVTQAEAGVAEREVTVIVAENRAGNAHDNLLNIVAAPTREEFASTTVVPETPTYIEYEVQDDVAIAKAMRHRPELAAARRTVEDAELQYDFARNQRLPRLDLTASYTFSGLSGPQKVEPGTPTGSFTWDGTTHVPGVTSAVGVESSSSAAHDAFFRADGDHGWSVMGRVEIPIGNRTARYRVGQREIELRRARTNLRRTEQDVILEVRQSARGLRSAIEALQATERRRVAQEETLRAERERLRLGDSTPFQVLEFEEDLAEAERQEILSLQTYMIAIAALERAQGTLLETRGISFAAEITR
jgi:outer membrane protein TolC